MSISEEGRVNLHLIEPTKAKMYSVSLCKCELTSSDAVKAYAQSSLLNGECLEYIKCERVGKVLGDANMQ